MSQDALGTLLALDGKQWANCVHRDPIDGFAAFDICLFWPQMKARRQGFASFSVWVLRRCVCSKPDEAFACRSRTAGPKYVAMYVASFSTLVHSS